MNSVNIYLLYKLRYEFWLKKEAHKIFNIVDLIMRRFDVFSAL